MSAPHVLLSENLSEMAPWLHEHHPGGRFTVVPDAGPLPADCLDAEVILRSAMNEDLFDDILRAAGKLRWVQITAAGFDWIGGEPLRRRLAEGLVLTRSAHSYSVPIGEYVIGAALMHSRGFPALRAAQERREWVNTVATDFIGSTMLVFGTGSIGWEVAWRAGALGATVLGVNRTGAPARGFTRVTPVARCLEVLPEADWVVLAMPLTPENRYLIRAEHFAAMKPSAVLVNVGRGALVAEEDLVAALTGGRIAGAVIDVFEEEPLPAASRLWELPRTTLTPHTSFRASGNLRRLYADFCANYDRFLAGEALEGTMRRPELGY
ncbi:hydroxyacid dehydrogenase [Spongiactinospora gelatinilytica]|uniref:Hydroxyacid dehydrogenase n=1 Tax=Spongiactinospora gelatinilytica TaxID=2666298 RepID=A0A2W2FYU2_9ACTN|nr:D-2-hydroxyacid dehydrogenase [Spongiactinospora gelatinilytica]PZG35299.1 hydroxyacid dehydrogenase [Spongiactinospora gelatinilytica]